MEMHRQAAAKPMTNSMEGLCWTTCLLQLRLTCWACCSAQLEYQSERSDLAGVPQACESSPSAFACSHLVTSPRHRVSGTPMRALASELGAAGCFLTRLSPLGGPQRSGLPAPVDLSARRPVASGPKAAGPLRQRAADLAVRAAGEWSIVLRTGDWHSGLPAG